MPLEHHLVLFGLLTCEDRHIRDVQANAGTCQMGICRGEIHHTTCRVAEDQLFIHLSWGAPEGAQGGVTSPNHVHLAHHSGRNWADHIAWQMMHARGRTKQTEPCVSAGL